MQKINATSDGRALSKMDFFISKMDFFNNQLTNKRRCYFRVSKEDLCFDLHKADDRWEWYIKETAVG